MFFVVLDECDEAIDSHIASHIVRLHQHREQAIDAAYTLEEVRRSGGAGWAGGRGCERGGGGG